MFYENLLNFYNEVELIIGIYRDSRQTAPTRNRSHLSQYERYDVLAGRIFPNILQQKELHAAPSVMYEIGRKYSSKQPSNSIQHA